MATPSLRLPENVPGAFYVTSECIDCDLCRQEAPDIYQRNDEIGFTVVVRQPESADDLAKAIGGMEGCPVDAIGQENVSSEQAPSAVAGQTTPSRT